MPGHVPQMQKLFQNAKATFRLDVRFAASPVGSIDARLPTNVEVASHQDSTTSGSSLGTQPQSVSTPSKDWRYSTAPGFLAEFELDVREPFPERSPQLPTLRSVDADQNQVLVPEPLSSGFSTPVNSKALPPTETGKSSSPPCFDIECPNHVIKQSMDIVLQDVTTGDILSPDDLQQPLENLNVGNDPVMAMATTDNSPTAIVMRSHQTGFQDPDPEPEAKSHDTISLSESAKAAATSAKVKRRILTELFPKPPTHTNSPISPVSSTSHPSKSEPTSCPAPLLHQRGPAVICPDPTLHFRPNRPSFQQEEHPDYPHQLHTNFFREHAGAYHRATDTGSPMPLLKARASTESPREMRRQSHETLRFQRHLHDSRVYRQQLDHGVRPRPSTADEHFQPGWYYNNEVSPPQISYGPELYSFSTAAAKVIGQDPAPDSRIRDSYRTDTLTPLAKPPHRFRKNGILALASSRGVGKYYGGPMYQPRASSRHMHFSATPPPDDVRFRSSPPRSYSASMHGGPTRKRIRDAEARRVEIFEDDPITEEEEIEIDPKLKLEEGEEVMELDEETRAAVRMSLYGTPSTQSSMKELSPNVTAWRKGDRPSGSRKKRRPSYWDGDLTEIVRSPAARRMVNSSVTKEVDLRSQAAEVEYEEVVFNEGSVQSEDELEGVSRTAEEPILNGEDVQMEY
ncbi:hypothetical protein LTR84_001692 [Exophiala bonariae]|uniref:Uncharacterized protein n=1 Tax=Exophiala bonariae TaxID=1690606 RepID=A0AAV9NB62_9EURO|nr:hypothetical protein LTR84_001692 [Exophiala bonariae]